MTETNKFFFIFFMLFLELRIFSICAAAIIFGSTLFFQLHFFFKLEKNTFLKIPIK